MLENIKYNMHVKRKGFNSMECSEAWNVQEERIGKNKN